MSDLRWAPLPSRLELRRALGPLLPGLEPGLRVLAEGVLGGESEADLLAADGRRRPVVVLVGEAGDDLEMLARGLALAEWCRRRVADWLQLAPELPLSAEAPGRVLLLCPDFHPETAAAAASLEPDRVGLARIRSLEGAHGRSLLLDPLPSPPLPRATERGAGAPAGGEPAPFRSGLREEDLDLTPEERRGLG